MKKLFDRKYIENILKENDTLFSEKLNESLVNVVSLAIEDLSTKIPFVTLENCIIQPVNETFSGALTPMSKYMYLLGIGSPQLEANCVNYSRSFQKFRKKLVQAWNDSRRKSKRKMKKEALKKSLEGPKFEEFEPERYNIESFKHDLQTALAQHLSETSIVYNTSDRLIIQGKDDFGSISQIELIPVIYDGEVFKYFISKRKGFMKINMKQRLLNFNIKFESVGENFLKELKIFNTLFKNITKEIPSQFFLESLLYNVPDQIYQGNDLYQITVNIINYLNMANMEDFVTTEDKSLKLFKSPLTKNSIILFSKFIKNI